MGKTINITVDGELKSVPAGLTVDGLLEHLDTETKAVIVEYNGKVLKQSEKKEVMVENRDIIHVVRFIEGG